jgi:hypothetical protein
MLTISEFRERKAEFNAVSNAKVQAALDDAEARTDAEVFGDLTDEAHMWLTAHLLAADPVGREARLKGSLFDTIYLAERQRLEALVAPGMGLVL